MDVITDGTPADLFMITEKGFGKRTLFGLSGAQAGGGQGVIAMKTDGERGKLAVGVRVSAGPAMSYVSELRDHDLASMPSPYRVRQRQGVWVMEIPARG